METESHGKRLGRARDGVVRAVLAALVLVVPHAAPPVAVAVVPRGDEPCIVALTYRGVVPGADAWGLSVPDALDVDHRGDIVIADTGNNRVVVVAPTGAVVTEFGGYGWRDGQFDSPSDLSVYPGFYIYVLDKGNRRVQRFDVDGNYLELIVDEDEAGTPVSIAVGQSGELFLVDEDSGTVLVRSQFDEELDPVGQFGIGEGGLVRPVAVATGPSRRIAVADPGRGSVEMFDEFGSYLGALRAPDTLSPDDVLFDRGGCALVADPGHGRVLAFPPGGGEPTASFDGDGGGAFWPAGLAFDHEGRLLVLDRLGARVLVIEMTYGDCPVHR